MPSARARWRRSGSSKKRSRRRSPKLKKNLERAIKAEEAKEELEEWKKDAEVKLEEGERRFNQLEEKHTNTCGKLDVERRRVRELTLLIEEGEESDEEMDDEDDGPAYLRDEGPKPSGPKMVILQDGTKVVKPRAAKERLRMAKEETEAAKEQTRLISAAVIDREIRMEVKNSDLSEMLRQHVNLIRHLKRANQFLEENVEDLNQEVTALKAANMTTRGTLGSSASAELLKGGSAPGGFLPMPSTAAPSTAGGGLSSDGGLYYPGDASMSELRSEMRSQELHSGSEGGEGLEFFWDESFEQSKRQQQQQDGRPDLPWQNWTASPSVVLMSPGRQPGGGQGGGAPWAGTSFSSSNGSRKNKRNRLAPLEHVRNQLSTAWR